MSTKCGLQIYCLLSIADPLWSEESRKNCTTQRERPFTCCQIIQSYEVCCHQNNKKNPPLCSIDPAQTHKYRIMVVNPVCH